MRTCFWAIQYPIYIPTKVFCRFKSNGEMFLKSKNSFEGRILPGVTVRWFPKIGSAWCSLWNFSEWHSWILQIFHKELHESALNLHWPRICWSILQWVTFWMMSMMQFLLWHLTFDLLQETARICPNPWGRIPELPATCQWHVCKMYQYTSLTTDHPWQWDYKHFLQVSLLLNTVCAGAGD